MQLVLENLKIALGELRANPFRSALTTLGIVIAVGAVIAVVSIVQGASRFMLEQFEGLGANAIWVFPDRPQGAEGRRLGRVELTYEDAEAIRERCTALAAVAPAVQRDVKVSWGGTETETRAAGTTPEFQQIRNWYADDGRFFTRSEIEARARVVVLGQKVVDDLGATRGRLLGQLVSVEGRPARVIGFLEEKGALFGNSQDDVLVMPITAAFGMFGERQRKNVIVQCQAASAEQTEEAVDQITWLLRLRHGRRRGEPDDFGIFTQDQFLDRFKQISVMVTGLLSGVVSVALLVGGIGIMNIMLVSVTERTREIGIRKALGAKNRDILVQFLIEAVALAILGGLVGIALGFLTGLFVREAITVWIEFPPVYVPLWAVAIAIGFSGSVGLISGLYPAWKAARLDPIEALRHD